MYTATSYFQNILPKPRSSRKPGRRAMRCWLVIKDPSGDFLGRSFRAYDLTGAFDNYWPEEIIFEHQDTGERKTWIDGRFFSTPPAQRESPRAI